MSIDANINTDFLTHQVSASFVLILQTLHSASLWFEPCVKSLQPKVITNGSAAAGVLISEAGL